LPQARRRMAWRVMMLLTISTMVIQHALVG
jgi:hypothetical protein